MNCHRVRDLLEEYFEGSLPTREHDLVYAHIAVCESCAAELRQIEKVAAALEAVPRAIPAHDLVSAISTRVAELPTPSGRRAIAVGWQRLGVLTAGFVAALAAVSYLLPALLARAVPASASATVWAKDGIMNGTSLITAAWDAVAAAAHPMLIVGKAAAPTLGLYVVAEVGILLALVLVLHVGRRRTLVRQTMVV